MCGICGTYSIESGKPAERTEIERMCQTIYHRGPDDNGIYIHDNVGLGIRRLSIIDVAGGKQPISNEDGSIWIVFNGEIYNHQELRKLLIGKGHCFSTNSDTESVLHLYEEKGLEFVDELNGMFAVAIWDCRQKRLVIARDRLGIKPLFYAHHNGQFAFASEMKAIIQDNAFQREIDDDAVAAYFTLSYIPAPLTIFSGIRKLLPGHLIIVQDGKVDFRKYWDIEFRADRSKKESQFIEETMVLLQESVDIRLMSDVPIGAFLSGGIDSSTIVALMSNRSYDKVNTFCAGFGGETDGYLDERKYAKMVAHRYSTNHREYEVSPEPGGILEEIVRAFDEPFADDSTIPSYYVYKMAKENVTVALSGLGGDEAFSGYERYLGFKIRDIYNRIPLSIRRNTIQRIVQALPERPDGHYTINHMKRFVRSADLPADQCYFGFISIIDDPSILFANPDRYIQPIQAVQDLILSYFNAPKDVDDLNRVFYCDTKTYLPEDILAATDRISMHHSLEVRVPFLDHRLMELAATIPPEMKMNWFQKKYLLKKAVRELLPNDVLRHRKQGFVGPMTQWIRKDLKPFVFETLSESELEKHGILNSTIVDTILEEHFRGKEIHDTLIWSLVVFQIWYRLYIEGNAAI